MSRRQWIPTAAELREGTNISVALSPDRSRLAVDLAGGIWTLPLHGGAATPLTGADAEAAQPDWAPDGRELVFQAYVDGNFHLCTVPAAGGAPRQLTSGPYDHREPRYAPDGRTIAFASDRGGNGYRIHQLDLRTGRITPWPGDPKGEEAAPAWSPDGERLAVLTDGTAIDAVDRAGVRRRMAEADDAILGAPAWTPDGREVAYAEFPGTLAGPFAAGPTRLRVGERVVSGDGEDVFPFRAGWLSDGEILYTADGRIRRRDLRQGRIADIPFTAEVPVRPRRQLPPRGRLDDPRLRPVRGIVAPALSPDGASVAFCALGDLWLLGPGGRPQRLTRDTYFVSDPAWSPDGRRLVYTSDRAGNPDLWLRDLDSGTDRRLTALPHAAVAAAFAPDGRQVAFQDQDGATYLCTVDTGEVVQVLAKEPMPGRPSFSPDGRRLAMAVVRPYSRRFREGTNRILVLDLDTGATAVHEVAPHRSISTRGYDGPVWAPDGRHLAYVSGSVLWLLPVDGRGRPTGAPRQLNDEVTDAPSFAADSATLLYLSAGRLRRIPASGGEPRPVPLSLHYAADVRPERTIVHAGRLWDGQARELRADVDIVIESGRIAAVRPHHGRADEDASGLTVLPGLMDMHAHIHMKGKFYGSRQGRIWLAYGITTVRSPADPVYQALEEREAVAAGRRLGPRYFGTGEALDGSRVHYSVTRPVTDEAELERELARAFALDYDLLKAYVRLPAAGQRAAAAAAHREGIWTTSHYLYPAARHGLDGMEHLGATHRLGYSTTLSRAGRSYQDVLALFAASGMAVTPTLILGALTLADHPGLVTDPRITALYPHWEQAELAKKLALVRDSPPELRRGLAAALAANAATVRRIHAAGCPVPAGTDAPIDHPGLSLHWNLWALADHGMPAYDTLRTATHDAAAALGVADQLGTVEQGKLADLVFVVGDPLADIRDTARVRRVMAAGLVHDVDGLIVGQPSP
ncbi:amidohydrolase family protein [Streptomyces boninensis]|uniref:amidohydrolase family protein n=1 Tax=Streptomyces boninensis TaxID=2039455 RepID=UPI003B214AC3